MATEIQPRLLASGAVGKRDMVVGNIVEEVNLVLVKEDAGSDGVDGSVTPAFVKKAPVLVERLKEVEVGLAAEPFQTSDLEVGPLYCRISSGSMRQVLRELTKWHLL